MCELFYTIFLFLISKKILQNRMLYDKINLIINILGLHYDLKKLSEDDKKTYQEWLKAKENKDYTKADELRKTLVNNNIL